MHNSNIISLYYAFHGETSLEFQLCDNSSHDYSLTREHHALVENQRWRETRQVEPRPAWDIGKPYGKK